MKHRHDGQYAVAFGESEHRTGATHQRVQVGRAMRIDDALWIACRADRITHRRRVAFINVRPVNPQRFSAEQFVITQHVAER